MHKNAFILLKNFKNRPALGDSLPNLRQPLFPPLKNPGYATYRSSSKFELRSYVVETSYYYDITNQCQPLAKVPKHSIPSNLSW